MKNGQIIHYRRKKIYHRAVQVSDFNDFNLVFIDFLMIVMIVQYWHVSVFVSNEKGIPESAFRAPELVFLLQLLSCVCKVIYTMYMTSNISYIINKHDCEIDNTHFTFKKHSKGMYCTCLRQLLLLSILTSPPSATKFLQYRYEIFFQIQVS